MKKRLFALAMALCMVFTMLPSVALAEGEAMPTTKWADHADTSWYTDAPAGTTEFVIDTAEELAGFAKLVDNGEGFRIPAVAAVKDADGNVITPAQPTVMKIVKLGADIDLAAHLWEPIGGTGNPSVFQGEFDGCGYTIRNLKLKDISSQAGLFGRVGTGGTKCYGAYIHDLTIDGATMLNCGGGVLMGGAFHSNVITDVTVKNVTINGSASAIASGVQGSQFKNVKAENITINYTGGGQIGGMFGSLECTGTVRTRTANPHFLDYTFDANGNALVNYFENCDGHGITINYTNNTNNTVDCFVGGFWSYMLSAPDATAICVNCDLTDLEITVKSAEGKTGGAQVGGFAGLRGGKINSDFEVMIDGVPTKLSGFNGCSVQGQLTTNHGTAGGFVGTSGDYRSFTPNFAAAEYGDITCDMNIEVTEGGTAQVGGFAGFVETNLKKTIPQSFNGCKVLGTIDAPQTATVAA